MYSKYKANEEITCILQYKIRILHCMLTAQIQILGILKMSNNSFILFLSITLTQP